MSLDPRKTDPELGKRVRDHLISKGLETPIKENNLSVKERVEIVQHNFENIIDTLGMDREDDSIQNTANRVAKMYVSELFYGLDYETFPKCSVFQNKYKFDEMVVERNVNVMSSCEHHFVTIDGFATIGYIPQTNVLGLSKLNRIVEYFSKRPQVQERLTCQIHEALKFILETEDVAVVIDAKHYCVVCRGVEDTNSLTTTSKLSGLFKTDSACRAEFMALSRR